MPNRNLLTLALLASAALPAAAQAKPCPADLSFTLRYAPKPGQPSSGSDDLMNDPCLRRALARAFPGKSTLPDARPTMAATIRAYVQVFSDGTKLQDGRYITFAGCVPHDCTEHGLLWIDTTGPGQIVFAASNTTAANKTGMGPDHDLRLYTSTPITGPLPPPLVEALHSWLANANSTPDIVTTTLINPGAPPKSLPNL